jgi:hypothetical protein
MRVFTVVKEEIEMKPISMLALSLCLAGLVPAHAADQTQSRDQTRATTQTQDRDRIYGYELMTPQERLEYRNHMRTMKTRQEREAFRLEHHKQMQERARAQGKTLPDMPPAGMGPGSGMGPGMGPGSGMMGPGGNRR